MLPVLFQSWVTCNSTRSWPLISPRFMNSESPFAFRLEAVTWNAWRVARGTTSTLKARLSRMFPESSLKIAHLLREVSYQTPIGWLLNRPPSVLFGLKLGVTKSRTCRWPLVAGLLMYVEFSTTFDLVAV